MIGSTHYSRQWQLSYTPPSEECRTWEALKFYGQVDYAPSFSLYKRSHGVGTLMLHACVSEHLLFPVSTSTITILCHHCHHSPPRSLPRHLHHPHHSTFTPTVPPSLYILYCLTFVKRDDVGENPYLVFHTVQERGQWNLTAHVNHVWKTWHTRYSTSSHACPMLLFV